MTPRHIITDAERGHRRCLSDEGPLIVHSIKLTPSLKKWCQSQGSAHIRQILSDAKSKRVYGKTTGRLSGDMQQPQTMKKDGSELLE